MVRFKKTTLGSFFGDFMYDQVLSEGHFLVQLGKVVDWDSFTPMLLPAYKGRAEKGESPYSPAMLLKMLFLAYLWAISERRVEELCNYYIPAKAFVGLGMLDRVPDHSTLTVFKERLEKHGGAADYARGFDKIVQQAMAGGVKLGTIQVVDAVHTIANVDTQKDRHRQEEGKPSADPDATVVRKGKRTVTEPDGSTEQKEIMYLGYKTRVSMDAETGIVTSIKPSVGNTADNMQMPDLLAHDQALGVPGETYAGDKAYDDGELHALLRSKGKHSALRLHDYRTEKNDDNKEPWLRILADPLYQAGTDVRYRIERKFAEAKLWHRFGRCRYRGLTRYKAQAYLTFMVLNLKRIVFLLTGARPNAIEFR